MCKHCAGYTAIVHLLAIEHHADGERKAVTD